MNRQSPQITTAHVVIIGAGLAGLSAAYELSNHDLDVHVLEASDRLGGRTWGHYWPEAQQHIDLGASWLTPAFAQTIDYVNKFHLATTETPTPEQYLTHFSAGITGQRFPSDAETAALRDASNRIRAAVDSGDPVAANAHDALHGSQMSTFCRDWHTAMQRYLAATDLHRVDPQHLLLDLEDLRDPEHYNIEIQGSMRQLVTALTEAIDVTVHRATPVAAVRQHGPHYEVRTADGEMFHTTAVILAVPLNVLKDIDLDTQDLGPLAAYRAEGHPGAARKDWFILTGVESPVRVFASTGKFGYFRTATRLNNGATLAVGLAPSHEGSPTLTELETAIQRYIPTAQLEAHYSIDWTTNPWAQGTWVTPPPGYYEAIAALDHTNSTFQIAGGDYSRDFPGTVEGAIMTGRQAAHNLLQQQKLIS